MLGETMEGLIKTNGKKKEAFESYAFNPDSEKTKMNANERIVKDVLSIYK